jgi:hypothetical protein
METLVGEQIRLAIASGAVVWLRGGGDVARPAVASGVAGETMVTGRAETLAR